MLGCDIHKIYCVPYHITLFCILHSSANNGNFVPSLGKMPRVYFKVRNINIHLVVLEELHNQRRINWDVKENARERASLLKQQSKESRYWLGEERKIEHGVLYVQQRRLLHQMRDRCASELMTVSRSWASCVNSSMFYTCTCSGSPHNDMHSAGIVSGLVGWNKSRLGVLISHCTSSRTVRCLLVVYIPES